MLSDFGFLRSELDCFDVTFLVLLDKLNYWHCSIKLVGTRRKHLSSEASTS